MNKTCIRLLVLGFLVMTQWTIRGEEVAVFEDAFSGETLKPGWSWVREEPSEWRLRDGALELRAQPGKIWSGNDAKNVMLWAPPAEGNFVAEVSVTQKADQKWEQVGLLWYAHDDQFVKLISEFIDGENFVVMARESRDTNEKNQVFAKIPIPAPDVRLRLEVRGDEVKSLYQLPGSTEWKEAATCALKGRDKARFGLFTQNGPAEQVHWARLKNFRVLRLE